jgi:hypothetical protein
MGVKVLKVINNYRSYFSSYRKNSQLLVSYPINSQTNTVWRARDAQPSLAQVSDFDDDTGHVVSADTL